MDLGLIKVWMIGKIARIGEIFLQPPWVEGMTLEQGEEISGREGIL
jgi:hypothetical protein